MAITEKAKQVISMKTVTVCDITCLEKSRA